LIRFDRLALTDFRNYRQFVWHPESPLVVLHGENGSGKTNLLEAISLLVPGRGLRGAPLAELPRHGTRGWGVAVRLSNDGVSVEIGTGVVAQAQSVQRQFRLDGAIARNRNEVAEHLACVWLTPQMDRLFQESSSGRRRFLDRLVLAVEPHHARELAAFERSLSERNRLLTQGRFEDAWLSAIEHSMARHAVAMTAARLTVVRALNAHDGVGEGFPETVLAMRCSVAQDMERDPALMVEDRLREAWRVSRVSDAARGATSMGPHRADVLFTERMSGRPASQSSTGQQKAMLLGTIFAHAQVMAAVRGQMPVLLLDEPLVHLDLPRREALVRAVRRCDSPVFLTGTDAGQFSGLEDVAAFHRLDHGAFADTAGRE